MPKSIDLVVSVVAASLFILLLMASAIMLFRTYLKRKNKLLLEKERMNIQFEQTLMQSQLEIQEQTFAHISREIHDNIGQVLSLVRININTLEDPVDTKKITLMDELMGKAITDLRTLSHTLDADYIRNNGWQKPVQKLLQDLQHTGKFTTYIQLGEDLPYLGNEKPIILFRMIQEVINNIIKHAGANKITFEAKKQENGLLIMIRDNGKGFDVPAALGGNGLRNLQTRASMINAKLNVDSEPGTGTSVSIDINTGNE